VRPLGSVVPGDCFWTIWASEQAPGILRVIEVREDYVIYEYLGPSGQVHRTRDKQGIFVFHLRSRATEEDWLCCLLTR
jgi:hypothetical protein